ncbi:MAG TPA: GNAT family N-acetyltransferase [Patescibacteria group bacterium]|nr:GNAT family N-acetyltransferase [Patescibacteria group bacterium]
MDFVYTDGSDQDFVALCDLLDDSLNESAGGEKNRSQYIQYNTLNDIHDVIVVYKEKEPIGCASFKLYDTGIAEVKRVFIKKEYQGKGISKQLMSRLEEKAIEKGYRKLILETGVHLAAANGLYRQIGYSVIENYGQYKGMKGSVCMEKIL